MILLFYWHYLFLLWSASGVCWISKVNTCVIPLAIPEILSSEEKTFHLVTWQAGISMFTLPRRQCRATRAPSPVDFAQNICFRKFHFCVHFLSTQLLLLLVIEDCVWKNKQYMTVLWAYVCFPTYKVGEQ